LALAGPVEMNGLFNVDSRGRDRRRLRLAIHRQDLSRRKPVDENEGSMGLMDHIGELRSRILKAFFSVFLTFVVIFVGFAQRLFDLAAGPLMKLLPEGATMVFTGLPDPFFTQIKVCVIAAVFTALPYVLYQIWAFVRPGLYPRERKLALPTIFIACLLFYVGALFCYLVVFPAAFKFFLSFETAELKPMIAIKEYVSLIAVLMFSFGLVFETPVIVVFVGLLDLVETDTLKKGRRYFIVLSFLIAAFLTPTPDPFNQAAMAVPMIILYELGLRVLIVLQKRRRADDEETETAESGA
jgi:sec-independent protein translocase protein TatC